MVDSVLGVDASGSLAEGAFYLGEFPPLGDVSVATPKATPPAWNLLDQSLLFFPPLKKDGQVRVLSSPEVMNSGAQQWCNALIGNFLGKSPPLAVFQRIANRLWGREGSVEIRFLAPSRALVLRQWVPGLRFDVVSLDSAPVWVKLWHVPLELFSREGLSYIASALGKPLYMDRATTLKMQLEFAKICIEVYGTDVIPGSVTLDLGEGVTIDVGVEIDWAPPKCDHCAIFGHSADKCSKAKGGVDVGSTVRVEFDAQVGVTKWGVDVG
ncbi:hypothetical protein V6N13_105323 [Hibiscus sabdariffa]